MRKLKDLRQALLTELGEARYKFVVKIDSDKIEIIESKNIELVGSKNPGKGRKGTLCRVTIHSIPALDFIWQINVEKNVSGLSPIEGSKTVDSVLALIDIDKGILRVYLIELKSKMNDHQLADIKEKLEGSINRFYFLLLLNDHKQFQNLTVSFKGVVFYTGKEELKGDCPDKDDQIHQIFKDEKNQQKGLLECATILDDRENISIQFYAKGFEDGEIRVSFADIAMK